jgi:hypothetical protein
MGLLGSMCVPNSQGGAWAVQGEPTTTTTTWSPPPDWVQDNHSDKPSMFHDDQNPIVFLR